MNAKTAYLQAIDKNMQDKLTSRCVNDLFKSLDINGWTNEVPGTIILYDDAINMFSGQKHSDLVKYMFENRQPRITYFLCTQDAFRIPPQLKRNCDTCIVFGGFTDYGMVSMLLRQLNCTRGGINILLETYKTLQDREGLVFDYHDNTCMVMDEEGNREQLA
jgi:hypothetical protein